MDTDSQTPRWRKPLLLLAGALQILVATLLLLSGPLWLGGPYALALTLAVAGGFLVLGPGAKARRPAALLSVLAIPVLTLGLTAGLARYEYVKVVDAACSAAELAAADGLRSPSGEVLEFEGTYDACQARVASAERTQSLAGRLAGSLRASGWTVERPQAGRMAHKDGVVLFVDSSSEAGTGLLLIIEDNPQ